MADILCYNKSFANVINAIESISSDYKLNSFSNFDIFTGKVENDKSKYATLEKNKWRLDGSYSLIDTNKPVMGYWSSTVERTLPPLVEPIIPAVKIKFKEPQTKLTMDGITIVFGDTNDFAHYIGIVLTYNNKSIGSYRQENNSDHITSISFEKLPDPVLEEDVYVTGAFDTIEIYLSHTENPYGRFYRISDIRFGYATWLTDADFFELSLLEEVSLVSDTIPINTLNFNINSDKYFMKKLSECDYIELFRDNVQFGSFYLQDSKRIATDQYEVLCSDIIQVMEEAAYEDNLYLSTKEQTVSVADVITDIMNSLDVIYIIDDALANSRVSIKIEAENKREALAQILLASNAVCKKQRNGVLWFGRLNTSIISGDITGDLFSGYTVTNNNPVSSISMSSVKYIKGALADTSNLSWRITKKTTDYLIVTISGIPSIITEEDIRINFDFAIVFYQDFENTIIATVNNPYSVTTSIRNYLGPLDNHNHPIIEGKYMPEKISISGSTISVRIDKEVIQRYIPKRKNEDGSLYYIGTRPYNATGEKYIGTDQNIYDADTYITPYADFTKAELPSIYAKPIVYAYTLDISTDTEIISISNPDLKLNKKTAQVLDIRTVEIAELFIDNKPDNTIDLLMDRYYKYNTEFEGKILTGEKKCGDTIQVTLPDIGEVTGTITQLDYTNLTNKLIANARIWLYYTED
ncbi:MAG: hypothetical protein J1F01_05705 [Oscillospiraceae bacterium]|nr:hypothetical protein [Oscillospiraceae bacterium]